MYDKYYFSFFGDPAPNCIDKCDACKDKKKCDKAIERFKQISNSKSLGTYSRMPDSDPVDLYEGGRWDNSKHESFDNYDDSENGGFRKASDLVSNRSIIDKQFAIRKANAAAAIEMEPMASISKVRAAMSTEKKVVGLTIKVRETNLKYLTDCLKANMENSAKVIS